MHTFASLLVLALAVFESAQADNAASNSELDLISGNNLRISDSRIVLPAQDKPVLMQHLVDAVLASKVDLNAAAKGKPAPADVAIVFPIARDAFLYVRTDPKTKDRKTRLGWRYLNTDWQVYKDLVPVAACEVNRQVGDYYYC